MSIEPWLVALLAVVGTVVALTVVVVVLPHEDRFRRLMVLLRFLVKASERR